jgi:hypothetical protein
MAIKIDIIRFFTTKLAAHGSDFWLEHGSNYAVAAEGASGAQLRRIIEKELGNRGASGCAEVRALTQPDAPTSFHESLDFEETESVDAIAYVFTLPPPKEIPVTDGVLHHTSDLVFLPNVGVPMRFVPKASTEFVHFGAVLDAGKSAWIEIDRKTIVKSSVATTLRSANAHHMAVPVGFDIVDRNVGISSWILPRKKAHSHEGAAAPLMWHGGPHPPENTSITVGL